MGSSSGGVGGSSSSSGGGNTDNSSPSNDSSSNSDNDNSPSGNGNNNDRDSSNDRSSSNSNNSRPDRESFNDTMSAAAASSGNTFGELANNDSPNNQDADRAADEAAQNAARDSFAHANEFSGIGPTGAASSQEHANEFSGLSSSGGPSSLDHANEFSGLGPSGGPPTGNDSLNSHRGYGSDGNLAQEQPAEHKNDATDLIGPAGYMAAAAQGAFQGYGNYVDYSGRRAAAGTLTNGPAGNLPAPGHANRAALGQAITDSKTARAALDVTPYGPNARSTQELSKAAQVTRNFGRAANGVALGLQPAAGAIEGYLQTPKDASWTETVTNSLVGAVKEVDDTAVSFGTGLAVTTVTAPVSGPGSIVAGVSLGAGAGYAYNDTLVDRTIDSLAEDYARPAIQGTLDFVDRGIDTIGDFFSDDDEQTDR